MVIGMIKKHFIALVKVIAATSDLKDRKRLCDEIGAICANVNPHFKWSTWRDACGCD